MYDLKMPYPFSSGRVQREQAVGEQIRPFSLSPIKIWLRRLSGYVNNTSILSNDWPHQGMRPVAFS